MPGPARWRTPPLINHLIGCKKVTTEVLSERASNVLSTVQRLARLSPDIVYSDGIEEFRETPEPLKRLCRKVAADGIVLLKNEGPILPIGSKGDGKTKVAVIGPNANARIVSGGGSAALKAGYTITPLEGLTAAAPTGIEISHSLGCYG
jgi:beta-glucosidase